MYAARGATCPCTAAPLRRRRQAPGARGCPGLTAGPRGAAEDGRGCGAVHARGPGSGCPCGTSRLALPPARLSCPHRGRKARAAGFTRVDLRGLVKNAPGPRWRSPRSEGPLGGGPEAVVRFAHGGAGRPGRAQTFRTGLARSVQSGSVSSRCSKGTGFPLVRSRRNSQRRLMDIRQLLRSASPINHSSFGGETPKSGANRLLCTLCSNAPRNQHQHNELPYAQRTPNVSCPFFFPLLSLSHPIRSSKPTDPARLKYLPDGTAEFYIL